MARTGSREIFTLCVIAAAVGIAYGSAALFGVSFALGAFFAGMVMRESALSHRAADESLPLRDAFSVLFFVSVGMLFDPQILVTKPLEVLTVVIIVLFGKSVAALLIVLAFRYPLRAALTVSAALAQIGEFSFILAAMGVSMGLLEPEAQSLILACALLSITFNPLIFATIGPVEKFVRAQRGLSAVLTRWQRLPDEVVAPVTLRDHVVLAGYGRVGHSIAARLRAQKIPFVVIEQNREALKDLEGSDVPFVFGDATNKEILVRARPEAARLLILATPDVLHAERVLKLVRAVNPNIDSAVRTHSEEELAFIRRQNVGIALMGEQELANGLTEYALSVYGREPPERAAAG